MLIPRRCAVVSRAAAAYFKRETRSDNAAKQLRLMQGLQRHPLRFESPMIVLSIVSAGFAMLILIALVLWRAGASEPRT